jgi:hypothetical protein
VGITHAMCIVKRLLRSGGLRRTGWDLGNSESAKRTDLLFSFAADIMIVVTEPVSDFNRLRRIRFRMTH